MLVQACRLILKELQGQRFDSPSGEAGVVEGSPQLKDPAVMRAAPIQTELWCGGFPGRHIADDGPSAGYAKP